MDYKPQARVRLPGEFGKFLVAAASTLLVVGSSCGEAITLTASGDLSGPFVEGGQVLNGTVTAAICDEMEGKFGSTGGYMLLDWDGQSTTLWVNFKRMTVTEAWGKVEKQTWDRTYVGPGVLRATAPSGWGGKFVFTKVKLNLVGGADWQERGPDGMIGGKAQPAPPGGGSVVLDGTVLCEQSGWF